MVNLKKTYKEATKCLSETKKFISQVTGGDPETRSISWDIEYIPDFNKVIQNLTFVIDELTDLHKRKPSDKLFELIEISRSLRNKIKRISKQYSSLKELSATSSGGASFTPGLGAQYSTPKAFNKNKNSDGAETIYYYKLGWKKVPKKIKGSGLEVKKLF